MQRKDSVEINNILEGLRGWKREKTPRKSGPYGSQRGFRNVSKQDYKLDYKG